MFERSPSACLTATAKICARCTWTAQGPGHGVGPQPKRYRARPCVSGPRNPGSGATSGHRGWDDLGHRPGTWRHPQMVRRSLVADAPPFDREYAQRQSGPDPSEPHRRRAGPRAVGTPCNAGARSATQGYAATSRQISRWAEDRRERTCRRQRWTDHGRFHDRPKRMRRVRGCRRPDRASSSSCPSADAHPERHAWTSHSGGRRRGICSMTYAWSASLSETPLGRCKPCSLNRSATG